MNEYTCTVSIKDPSGKIIYEAATIAKAGVILSGLNIAKQRFVEWLKEHEDKESDG